MTRDRLTDLCQFLIYAEGLPPQTPLSQVFDILSYRREQDFIKDRRLAETLVRVVKLATEGGVFMDVVSHLYPNDVLEDIKRRKADQEDEADQIRRLALVKAIAQRFER